MSTSMCRRKAISARPAVRGLQHAINQSSAAFRRLFLCPAFSTESLVEFCISIPTKKRCNGHLMFPQWCSRAHCRWVRSRKTYSSQIGQISNGESINLDIILLPASLSSSLHNSICTAERLECNDADQPNSRFRDTVAGAPLPGRLDTGQCVQGGLIAA